MRSVGASIAPANIDGNGLRSPLCHLTQKAVLRHLTVNMASMEELAGAIFNEILDPTFSHGLLSPPPPITRVVTH